MSLMLLLASCDRAISPLFVGSFSRLCWTAVDPSREVPRQLLQHRYLPDLVPDSYGPSDDDRAAETPQSQRPANLGVDEARGVPAEARLVLPAPDVGFCADLDDRRADGQPGAGGEVLVAQVEVHVELVAAEGPALPLDRHEQGHPAVRHGDLLGEAWRAVGGVAAAATPPVVADHALGAVQDRLLQHQAAGVIGAAGDELNGALVAWGAPDVVEPGFECEAAQVLHCSTVCATVCATRGRWRGLMSFRSLRTNFHQTSPMRHPELSVRWRPIPTIARASRSPPGPPARWARSSGPPPTNASWQLWQVRAHRRAQHRRALPKPLSRFPPARSSRA